MRKVYVLVAAVAMLVVACKKDRGDLPQETNVNSNAEATNSFSNCTGNNWTYATNFSSHGIGMVFNDKLYVPDKPSMTVQIYDGTSWTSVPSAVPFHTYPVYPGNTYVNGGETVAFTIGDKGYIFIPYNPENSHVDTIGFWEYNFTSNTWRRRANFPGPPRDSPAWFVIGGKAYVVGGHDGDNYTSEIYNYSDTWQYNPATNAWTQKADLGHIGRSSSIGFSIGGKGYIMGGRVAFPSAGVFIKDLLEYDPVANTWTLKGFFPGTERGNAGAFVISDKAYVGGGQMFDGSANVLFKDFYRYTPSTNSWTQVADYPFALRTFFGFSLNSSGYIVADFGNFGNHVHKYTPRYCLPIYQ